MPIIVWFRRDFRIHDNTALYHAAKASSDGGIIPVFIFDDAILSHPDTGSAIVHFMIGCLRELRTSFERMGVKMLFLHGRPVEQLVALVRATGASAVYFNKDYSPMAIERDEEVMRELPRIGAQVRAFKDQVIFEEREILAASTGEPFTVYTPYSRAWRARLAESFDPQTGPKCWASPRLEPFDPKLQSRPPLRIVELYSAAELGFDDAPPQVSIAPGENAAREQLRRWCAERIGNYAARRNFPGLDDGTSQLSPHLRHGTLSPRQCVRAAMQAARERRDFRDGADAWIGELIWREFYQQILFNFPHVVDRPFRQHMSDLPWEHDRAAFDRWCRGMTGFPIVDAGMRQLNQTGWLHNRLRMIVAMFLTKDLLIDYRWGERYFMQRLIDGETAQNNGGWQWSASTGTDAQPFFRIFNPVSQSQKFDPDGVFIRKFLPELRHVPGEFIHFPAAMTPLQQEQFKCRLGTDYPLPMVDHSAARKRALEMFSRRS